MITTTNIMHASIQACDKPDFTITGSGK